MSFQDLKPNPQDITSFYLANIYLLLANPNASQASISSTSTLPTPPAFSPPRYVIWVNSLWFLSVASSLTGAGLAMFLQQWAHRYIEVTQQPWFTPDQRARIRQTFFNHARGPYVFWGTGPMTFFVHLSIFLFMAGGLIYLFNINRAVFSSLGLWILTIAVLYFLFTAVSIFKPELLFYASFSPLALRVCLWILYAVLQVSSCVSPLRRLCDDTRRRYDVLRHRYHEGFLEGKRKAAEEAALKRSSEIDVNVLEWTFNCLFVLWGHPRLLRIQSG